MYSHNNQQQQTTTTKPLQKLHTSVHVDSRSPPGRDGGALTEAVGMKLCQKCNQIVLNFYTHTNCQAFLKRLSEHLSDSYMVRYYYGVHWDGRLVVLGQ